MNNKSCLKEFIKYTSLNILGMIGLSCYILADTYFVSKGLGANGLAALNLAIPFYSFIHGSGLMLGMGGATKYSILKSQNKTDKANQVFTNTIVIMFCLATVFLITGLFFSDTISRLLGADEAVFEMSRTYLQIILLFSPTFMLNNVLLCFIRNDGSPQLSMIAMISSCSSNIVLDYIFIILLQMGMFGAAFTTGLSSIISIIILSSFFIRKKNCFRLVKCAVSRRLVNNIFSCGLPSLITEVSSGIVIIVFNIIILRLQGNIGVAAYGVIANLSLVVIAVYTGIAQGIQPIISSNHGSGNNVNVKLILRYALVLMTAVSLAIYPLVFFGSSQIASIFNSEQNPLLQNVAITGMKIYFIACLFAGFNIVMCVYFTSTESVRPAHIISFLRGFLVIIPMTILLSSIGGMMGVWSAFPTTELMVSVLAIILFVRSKKIGKRRAI